MLFESVGYIHCGFSGSLLAIMWHGPVEESGTACLEFYVRVWELQVVQLLTIQSSCRTVLNLPSCIVFVCIMQWITEQYLVVQNKHNSVNKQCLIINQHLILIAYSLPSLTQYSAVSQDSYQPQTVNKSQSYCSARERGRDGLCSQSGCCMFVSSHITASFDERKPLPAPPAASCITFSVTLE